MARDKAYSPGWSHPNVPALDGESRLRLPRRFRDRAVNVPTTFEDVKILREEMGADFRAAISGTAPDQKKAHA